VKHIPTLYLITLFFALSAFSQTSSPTPTYSSESSEKPAAPTQPSPSSTKPLAEYAKSDIKLPANPAYVRKDAAAQIPHFEAPPVIDGQLNDAVWQHAAVFGDFLQIQPGDNVPPSSPTEVLMGYDAKNLYIAFRITEPRDKVRANVARRDNIFDDDYVGLYFDTFNDKRQAYCLFFNPLGIQADGTFTEGNGEDYSVDLVMDSKGVLTSDGFTIEIAIPFKSLRYEAGKDKQWGVQLFRRIKYNNAELDSWMPVSRSISGTLSQAGHITGMEGIETSRQLEINPSFTLSESGRRTRFTFNNDPAGRFVNDGLKGDFGLTAKLGLTPTITLDFAYNPDFAQVEADSPVSTANVRFPIFFPEKRPFFLERIDIFNSGLNLVNTRAIVDPDVAAKLTGRHGKNTFGILYASDNAPGNYSKDERETLLECRLRRLTDPSAVCGIERFVDKNADIGVLRLKRDIGKEDNLGFFATTYNFVDRHNNVGGFDGRFRFDPKTVAEFQVVGTTTRGNFYDPDQDKNLYRTGNGIGYRVWAERASRNLYMNYLAQGRSANYRADVGFTQRVDTNYLGSFIRYKTEQDAKKKIIYKRIQNATNVSYDWNGRGQYWISDTQGMLALQRQTYIGIDLQYGHERVYEHEFGPNRTFVRPGAFFGPNSERGADFRAVQAFIESTPNKQFYINLFMDYTSGIMEYDFGAGPKFPRVSRAALDFGQSAPLDPGPGKQLTIQATVRYQPTAALQTQLDYTKRRLVRNDTGLVAFDENLFSSRSTYQFTRNTFARLRLDYSTLNTHLRPQFVLGWTPNPGTALYVGYNDDFNYNGFNPYTGRFEPGLHGNGRSFFIKASYLFRKSF
jgi:hypothetical protein